MNKFKRNSEHRGRCFRVPVVKCSVLLLLALGAMKLEAIRARQVNLAGVVRIPDTIGGQRELFSLDSTGLGDADDELMVELASRGAKRSPVERPIHMIRTRESRGKRLAMNSWPDELEVHSTSKKLDETLEPAPMASKFELPPSFTLLTTRKRPLASLTCNQKNDLPELSEEESETQGSLTEDQASPTWGNEEDSWSSNYLARFARKKA